MAAAFAIVVSLLVLIWATSFVARHVPVGLERTLLFALIWLVPGGVIVSVAVAVTRKEKAAMSLDWRMFEAVVEKHKQIHKSESA